MKKTNGITLIALVITIIVLLILAGVSISMLSGDNSILNKGTEAKNQTNEKNLKEEVQVTVSGRLIEKKTRGTNAKTLEEELREKISNADEITVASLGACYVKRDNTELTVYDSGEIEDGKFEIWDGSTVECPEFKKENNIWNWYIYKPSQLKFLADFVNDENKGGTSVPDNLRSMVTNAGYNAEEITMTTDVTIYLMNNLDLGARQTNGTKTTGTEWIPIGIKNANVTNKFGTFDGNNNVIKGIYINSDKNYIGFFSFSNKIQNLNIKDSYIEGIRAVGGIVGYTTKEIENCHNKNTTVTGRVVGGIVGMIQNSVKKCTNNGLVNGTSAAGGISGAINAESSEVIECENYGNITGNNYLGGIIGDTYAINKISKCKNHGTIEGTTKGIGGIGGFLIGNIEECINTGKIRGEGETNQQIGGIAGAIGQCDMSKCSNSGDISGLHYIGRNSRIY